MKEWEFYDLQQVPQEQHNLIRSTAHQAMIAKMKQDLIEVRKQYEDTEPAINQKN